MISSTLAASNSHRDSPSDAAQIMVDCSRHCQRQTTSDENVTEVRSNAPFTWLPSCFNQAISFLQDFKSSTSGFHGGFQRKSSRRHAIDLASATEEFNGIIKALQTGKTVDLEDLANKHKALLRLTDHKGWTLVHYAASEDQADLLQLLINLGADINTLDHEGNTPLHQAVEHEALQCIDLLILSGACTGILNNAQMAPIHLATQLNKAKILERLVSHRREIDIMQPGEHGRTPLHIAAIHDSSECARVLLNELPASPGKSCENGYYPMHEAARHGSCNTMVVFLEWSESVGRNKNQMMTSHDAEGSVPIHSAVHSGSKKAVELCLKSGAKISAQQYDLSTPVHLAAAQGTLELLQIMFDMQPEEVAICLAIQDGQKMTPLHCAAMFDHDAVVHYLVQKGADIEARDCESRTSLLLATSRSAWKTARVLIRLGAAPDVQDANDRNILHLTVMNKGRISDVHEALTEKLKLLLNKRDSDGCSPLHYASLHGYVHSTKELLSLGADISVKNIENKNPLHLAAKYGRYHTVRLLLNSDQSAAVINESDGNGLTPLHIASQNGHNRVVQFLVNRGALLHRDYLGRTPLHLAAIAGHTETLQLLLSIHSHLLDQQDKDGNTSLHLATIENKPAVINLLLSMDCKLIPNNKSLQPIDYAIFYRNHAAALALVTHERRGDEIMLQRSERTPCVMIALVNGLPDVAEAVMDRCIVKANCKSDSKSFYVKYSFRYLQMPIERLDMYRKLHNNPNWKPEPLSTMNAMVHHGRVELLSHPLCQKYLEFKWRSYGMYFHLADLLLYIVFLSCVTIFSSGIVTAYLRGNTTTDGKPGGKLGNHENEFLTFVCEPLILAYTSVSAVREFCHIVHQRYRYFCDISNIVAWILYITTAIMVVPSLHGNYEPLSFSCAAYATFLCWFNLLIYLQRFDHVGIYVVMFLEILKTLLKVLLVFSILIIAFGMAFYILLSREDNQVGFIHLPIAFLRTFSMMLGEIDFLGTFVRPFYQPTHQTHSLPHTTFLMLSLFMILMPILLMNLLIGLAVGDIESVRRNAQLKRLAMQVELHTDLERRLPQFMLDRVDRTDLVEYPNSPAEKTGWLWFITNCFLQSSFQTDLRDQTGKVSSTQFHPTSARDPRQTLHTKCLSRAEQLLNHGLTEQGRMLLELKKALYSQQHVLAQIAGKLDVKLGDDLDEGLEQEDLLPVGTERIRLRSFGYGRMSLDRS